MCELDFRVPVVRRARSSARVSVRAMMQPGTQSTPNKSNVGKIVAGCAVLSLLSCCCFSGLGGYVAYLDNRSTYTPGDEVSRGPLAMDAPQNVTVSFDGSGFAFAQIWAEIEGEQAGTDVMMTGDVTCAQTGMALPESVDVMVWDQNMRVANYQHAGSHVVASVMVHDEYMRSGAPPRSCVVTLHVTGATITRSELVLRTYQRPSDRFAN